MFCDTCPNYFPNVTLYKYKNGDKWCCKDCIMKNPEIPLEVRNKLKEQNEPKT